MPVPPSDNTNDTFPVTPALTDELTSKLVQLLEVALNAAIHSNTLPELFDLTHFMRDKVLVAHNFITKEELAAPSLVEHSLELENDESLTGP